MNCPPANPSARALLKRPTDRPRATEPPRALTIESITGAKPAAKTA